MTDELQKVKASLSSLASNILSADPGKEDLSIKTKSEIKTLADSMGISLDSRLTKAKMIDYLESSDEYNVKVDKKRSIAIQRSIVRST